MSVSTALPRRISIYEGNGKAILATLKPTSGIRLIASCLTVKQTPGRSHNAHSPMHLEVDKAGQSPTCGRLLTKGPQQDGAGLGCLLGE
jgi:hypothetical protein